MQEEKNDLKMELLIRKEAEFKDLENSQASHIEKNGETCWGGTLDRLVWIHYLNRH